MMSFLSYQELFPQTPKVMPYLSYQDTGFHPWLETKLKIQIPWERELGILVP